MNYINEHLNKEKDGINITLFNQNEYYLQFYLTSNKNKQFELELHCNYAPKKLKFESIKIKLFKNETLKELNQHFDYLSYFFKKINELYNH